MEDFVEKLKSQISIGLPGKEAHLPIAPLNRAVNQDFNEIKKTAKLSAVLVLLFFKEGEWWTMLMERNSYNGHHSKQISFPGGRVEPEDNNLKDTALREFAEEMGVILQPNQVLSKLTQLYIPPSNFYVQPFIASTTKQLNFIPEEKEVNTLIPIPLKWLVEEIEISREKVTVSGGEFTIQAPSFKYNEHIIWGATAMILNELRVLIKRMKY